MPMYIVTVEAKRIVEMDQQIEVEAKNKSDAKRLVEAMIDRDQIRERNYSEITSYLADESIVDVEKK